MMPIDQSIGQIERWITSIHQERDRMAQVMGATGSTDIECAFASARLAYLDVALEQAKARLVELQPKRYWEELMFETRPTRQLKVPLRKGEPARKRA